MVGYSQKLTTKFFKPKTNNPLECWSTEIQDEETGQVVAVLNYLFDVNTRILRSKITIVEKAYRRQGLAKRLWSETLTKHSPRLVSVSTVSEGGEALTLSLKRTYVDIEWDLW